MLSGNVSLLADLRVWGVVLLVSVLDTAAALVPYYAGRRGIKAVLDRFPRLRRERLERIQRLYEEHGSGFLFFCFLPMLGVLLSAGAGIAGVQVVAFVPWVLAGKTVRWSMFLVLFNQTLQILS
ncbi:MAG: VTT domain-containing protein [Anaerolineae bacterium]|jgi:membrane protein DedA with SNARE-associated domain